MLVFGFKTMMSHAKLLSSLTCEVQGCPTCPLAGRKVEENSLFSGLSPFVRQSPLTLTEQYLLTDRTQIEVLFKC